jgi:FtsH-binding integral membrane protein
LQLVVTWLSAISLLDKCRHAYHAKATWISGGRNRDGALDLDLDWETVKPYFYALLGIDFCSFIALMIFGEKNLYIGFPLFTFWSILTGIELALCLISVDENLGGKVLGLTALITLITGVLGIKSHVDFSFMGSMLLFGLSLVIIAGLLRIFFSIPRWVQRLWALFGVALFSGYLLYDFSRLATKSAHADHNTWGAAMRMSISIYLDIVNLFLHLLDLLSK